MSLHLHHCIIAEQTDAVLAYAKWLNQQLIFLHLYHDWMTCLSFSICNLTEWKLVFQHMHHLMNKQLIFLQLHHDRTTCICSRIGNMAKRTDHVPAYALWLNKRNVSSSASLLNKLFMFRAMRHDLTNCLWSCIWITAEQSDYVPAYASWQNDLFMFQHRNYDLTNCLSFCICIIIEQTVPCRLCIMTERKANVSP